MLKLYDSSHNPLGNLVKYKDCKKESEAATGDATLSFTYLAKRHNIRNEYYVRTKDAEYTVKEVNEDSRGFPQIVAVLNLEDLQRESWESYSITDMEIGDAARPLLERVGWSLGECSITKHRNAAMVQVTTLGIIQNLCTVFMCEPVFDNIRRTVSFYEERGGDKGVYFMQGLNLRKLDKQNNSYDYYTQIIPIGADGLTIEGVNGGKKYLENYQYSNKILPYIWKDESYTDAQALKEDAELKLKDLSRPAVSYSADVIDLAKKSRKYSVLEYALGDRVTLIDRHTGTREAQRIVRMVEYEKAPEKNTCELGNTVLTFEELQEKLEAAADLVNNTMTSDGKIHVSDILNWEKGLEDSQTVGDLQKRVSGMNAVSYNNAAPKDAEAGDIWFDQENGNKPHQYDGEEWQEEQFGTEALKAKAVTAEKIDVEDLFAQNIKATGKIEGLKGSFSGDVDAETFTAQESISLYLAGWLNTTPAAPKKVVKADPTQGILIIGDTGAPLWIESDSYRMYTASAWISALTGESFGAYMGQTGGISTTDLICDKMFSKGNVYAANFYVGSTPVALAGVSDVRLKENIRPSAVKALSAILRIKMRQFDWTDGRGHQDIGFVADELEKIDQKLAHGGGYNENGGMNIKTVDEFYLLGYAVKAIQELHAIVRRQEAQIRNLQKKIDGRTAK